MYTLSFSMKLLIYIIVFLYGVVIGSFLNVCILRIPNGETIVSERSHCMKCGYQLAWFDLIPLFSYIFLRGRCRKCGEKISLQYPLIEALNGILWTVTLAVCGFNMHSILCMAVISAMVVLSMIDARTMEIPVGINIFIFVIAVINFAFSFAGNYINKNSFTYNFFTSHMDGWLSYVLGFVSVSVFLLLVYFITKGRGIGGGDIKLMAAAGLFLGLKLIIFAFVVACLYACIIHIARMKITKASHVLAMGPYLSAGILSAMWFGKKAVDLYLNFVLGK